ncbi:MAG: hypothetical protein EGR02_08215 [Clostridiales bacterium]|nr:hypothetical protein [Clostridiales bacterium]
MKTTTEFQLVPVTKLVPSVNNARTHSPEQINKVRIYRQNPRRASKKCGVFPAFFAMLFLV